MGRKLLKAEDAHCIAETFLKDVAQDDKSRWTGSILGNMSQSKQDAYLWTCHVGWSKDGEPNSDSADSVLVVDSRTRKAMWLDEYLQDQLNQGAAE